MLQQSVNPEAVSALERCAICTDSEARYRCPRCALRTCSVSCVRRHKAATGCNGQRDILGFVKISQYAEPQLLSDYRFLEGVDHAVDSVQRFRQNLGRRPPRFLDEVVTLLRQRDDIQLRLAPPAMTRRLTNRTRYQRKTKLVHWTLELVLLPTHATGFSVQQVDERCTELLDIEEGELVDEVQAQDEPALDLDADDAAEEVENARQVADVMDCLLECVTTGQVLNQIGNASAVRTSTAPAPTSLEPVAVAASDSCRFLVHHVADTDSLGKVVDRLLDAKRTHAEHYFQFKTWLAERDASKVRFAVCEPGVREKVQISGAKPLRKALRGRIIYEFPTIFLMRS